VENEDLETRQEQLGSLWENTKCRTSAANNETRAGKGFKPLEAPECSSLFSIAVFLEVIYLRGSPSMTQVILM
jgi:hypothetical protein